MTQTSKQAKPRRAYKCNGEGDTMISKVQTLKDRGFDLSYAIPFERAWRVRCSQCAAVCINGIPCHETGCPNMVRNEGEDDNGNP